MITRTDFEHLKCFERLALPLAELTLLTGFNAGGKSTVIQSLLLLTQSVRSGAEAYHIGLNGPLTRLGTVREVVNGEHRELTLGVRGPQADISWRLSAEDRRGTILDVSVITTSGESGAQRVPPGPGWRAGLPQATIELLEMIRDIVFISAIRSDFGPTFPSPEGTQPVHADVGPLGQYAPWWLAHCSDEPVAGERCHPGEENPTLRSQVSAWAGELFPGAEVDAGFVDLTDLVRLSLRRAITEEWRRPANIGYGLTYAFPILVAGLLAKPGQVLIIDSPEAHLHPRAQSTMAKFLATMAKAGVQVIVETHSDHVLNGVRLAVKNGTPLAEKVAIHFFTGGEAGAPQVISTRIDSEGNVTDWPGGFFDQAEKDLAALAGWA